MKPINHISNDKLKVSCDLGSSSRGGGSNSRRFNIALIKPIFTAAQYNIAFYKFCFLSIHILAGFNLTTHLNLLSNRVTNHLTPLSSSTMSFFQADLNSILHNRND